MLRKIRQAAFIAMLALAPIALAQQNPPAGGSSAPPRAKSGQSQTSASNDSSGPPPATAEEDVDVGTFYLHKGDYDAAIPRLEEAVRLKPKFGEARLLLAEAYEKKGDKADALTTYKDYLSAFPKARDAKKIQQKIEKLSRQ